MPARPHAAEPEGPHDVAAAIGLAAALEARLRAAGTA
jgi:hypothetical protein